MEFKKVLKDIQNKKSRKKGTKAYYASGKIFFSRIFGYSREGDNYIPIEKYANAIKLIYQMLIDGSSLPDIKQKLDGEGYRDASNNRFSIDRICSVVRPVYCSYLKKNLTYHAITNIEPIVSLEDYKKAKKQLDREQKNLI